MGEIIFFVARSAAKFVCVASPIKQEWVTLTLGSAGLRLNVDLEFSCSIGAHLIASTFVPLSSAEKIGCFRAARVAVGQEAAGRVGADSSALIYSLIETAKANELEPWMYLRYLFEKLPLCQSDDEIRALLPHRVDRETVEKFDAADR